MTRRKRCGALKPPGLRAALTIYGELRLAVDRQVERRRSLGAEAPESVLLRGEVPVCMSEADLADMRDALALVTVSEALIEYAVQVVRRTRADDAILVGAGPRASQSLLRAGRAWAALAGRDFVSPDDVRAVALPVLEHRLLLRPESELEGVRPGETLDRILHEVAVPR